MTERQLFLNHLAPTSPEPMALAIEKAKGSMLYGPEGRSYIDLIGGISVCNVGHCHPRVIEAVHRQSEQYLHVMVYGEVVQRPQVRYASLLAEHLPPELSCVYFTNSGAEAVDGAMKLAKRVTGRPEIVACHNSYHGSTQGPLSIMGDEYWRSAYRPLIPGIRHVSHNSEEMFGAINEETACVIIEVVQAEAGIRPADQEWLIRLRERCDETGAMLVFDEIQTGFGRTGSLWAFEQYGVVPDILLLGKALGGGMPLGAFLSSKEHMSALADKPVLGHLTTFGGHPVSCAAGLAAFQVLLDEKLYDQVEKKEALFRERLDQTNIVEIRSKGLMMAVDLGSFDKVKKAIAYCIDRARPGKTGAFTDWFLFAPECIRLVPPLTISHEEIEEACSILTEALETVGP